MELSCGGQAQLKYNHYSTVSMICVLFSLLSLHNFCGLALSNLFIHLFMYCYLQTQ